MNAAEQTALDFGGPAEGVNLISTPPRRDEIGFCDACGGPTWGTSYGVRVDGKMLLVCGRCDREVRQ